MINLDDLDRRILNCLQEDATLSHQEVAERVGTSATSCWRRIKSLEETGVIRKRVALLDAAAVGRQVNVLCSLHLKSHSAEVRSEIETFVASCPEVMECYSMSGDTDYILRIVVPNVEAYEHFLMTQLLMHPHIASANSSFALRQVKYTTSLPI